MSPAMPEGPPGMTKSERVGPGQSRAVLGITLELIMTPLSWLRVDGERDGLKK